MQDLVEMQYRNDEERRREMRRQRIGRIKASLKMTAHSVYWRTLFFFGIGWAYSRFMCRRGWYRKFPDGRCMFCGIVHK